MVAVQNVLALRQRVEDRPVVEFLRQHQIIGVAGQGVKLGERLVHAALFANQHFLPLIVREIFRGGIGPVGEVRGDFQRLRVVAQLAGVNQPREFLVERIPRNPAAVEVETSGPDFAAGNFVENLLAVRHGRHVAVAIGLLALGELVHDVIHPFQKLPVAGVLIHPRTGREIMSEAVAGDALRFPAAIDLGLRFQTRLLAEPAQEAIRLQTQEIFRVHFHRALEEAVQQTHIFQRKLLRRQINRRVHVTTRAPRDHRQCQENGNSLDFHVPTLCPSATLIIRARTEFVP